MQIISAEEQARRHAVNESVIGTSAMEGVTLDAETLALMRQFESGGLSREQLSAAIDEHVARLLVDLRGASHEDERALKSAA